MTLFCCKNNLRTLFCRKYNQRTLFCCKNDLSTLVLLQKQFTHIFLSQKLLRTFFVTKRIHAPFFVAKKIYALFLSQKTIYALRPESFCALKVAIRKDQTFWASASPSPKSWLYQSSLTDSKTLPVKIKEMMTTMIRMISFDIKKQIDQQSCQQDHKVMIISIPSSTG